jgi:hypothetical protein
VYLTHAYLSDKFNGGKWMMDVGSEVMSNNPTLLSKPFRTKQKQETHNIYLLLLPHLVT